MYVVLGCLMGKIMFQTIWKGPKRNWTTVLFVHEAGKLERRHAKGSLCPLHVKSNVVSMAADRRY